MHTVRKPFSGTAIAVLVGVGLYASTAQAQLISPGFRIRPATNINVAAINQGLSGSVYPGVSPISSFPYANPLYNPYVNPLINPFANPYLNPAINPGALANYYNPYIANPLSANSVYYRSPLFNPYANVPNIYTGGIGAVGGVNTGAALVTNPNPYVNPYAGLVNPYAAGAAMTATTNPYGGYGDSMTTDPYSNPYYGYGESQVGGYLRGAADLMTSQGKWFKDLQQAQLLKEQTRQARMDTQRKKFDEWLYEREHTPTFEQDRQKLMEQDLARSLNNPPLSEVWTGQALNNILDDIAKMDAKKLGTRAPQIPLDEDTLRHLNLTSGGNGNPGILRNDGRLTWPLPLKSDDYQTERQLINNLAPELVNQAVNGRVDAGALRDLTNAVAGMRQKLSNNIRDLTPNQYIEASRYLGYLEDAIRILNRPNAGDFFSQRFAAKGGTAGDLAHYMISKGLRFAPAVAGDEAAYAAVQRALTAYDLGSKAQLTADVKEPAADTNQK